jgi:hypothetical protein
MAGDSAETFLFNSFRFILYFYDGEYFSFGFPPVFGFPILFLLSFLRHDLLICFEEKNFRPYFWERVPPDAKYRQNFFSSKHINMGTICKISSNRVEICVLLKYFDPILTNTSQKYEFLGIKLR